MKRLDGKRGDHHYNLQEVLYLIGNINYCYMHQADGQVILSCRTLKWFADQWPDFIRVHKNALVNPAYVASYQPSDDARTTSYILMTDNRQLEIARRRVYAVGDLLDQTHVQAANQQK